MLNQLRRFSLLTVFVLAATPAYAQTCTTCSQTILSTVRGDATPGTIFTSDSGDPDAAKFYLSVGSFQFDPGRKNVVWSYGYNVAQGGGPVNPSEPTLSLQFESFYKNRLQGPNPLMEHHLQYVNPAGTIFRPLSWNIDRTTDNIEGYIRAKKFSFFGQNGTTQYMIFQPPIMNINAGLTFQIETNNAPFIKYLNSARTAYIELARIDAQDRVSLAPAGGPSIINGALQLGGSDTGLKRDSAGIVTITDGANGKGALKSGGQRVGITRKSSAYTATATDYVILVDASAGPVTITLTPAANEGQVLVVKKVDTSLNAVTVASVENDNIEGVTSIDISSQYAGVYLVADGVSTWYLLPVN